MLFRLRIFYILSVCFICLHMIRLDIFNMKGALEVMPNKTIKIGKKQFYNVEILSKMLFIPVDTVRKYIRKGRIKAIKIGKFYLVSEENLQKFLDGEGDK